MSLGCLRARKRLWAYLEGGPVEPWLADHVRHCPACASEAARLRREGARLQDAADRPPLPDADVLWSRIEARLPRRRRAPWPALAYAAPLALFVALLAARPFGTQVEKPNDVPAPPKIAAIDKHGTDSKVAPVALLPESRPVLTAAHPEEPRQARRTASRPHHASGRIPRPAAPSVEAPRPDTVTPPASRPAAEPEEPVAAVVVVQADEGAGDAAAYAGAPMACRSETVDPVSGEVTRQAVSWETDAAGTTHLTIEFEVQRAGAPGASSGSKT